MSCEINRAINGFLWIIAGFEFINWGLSSQDSSNPPKPWNHQPSGHFSRRIVPCVLHMRICTSVHEKSNHLLISSANSNMQSRRGAQPPFLFEHLRIPPPLQRIDRRAVIKKAAIFSRLAATPPTLQRAAVWRALLYRGSAPWSRSSFKMSRGM